MKKYSIKPLFFCVLALAVSSFANFTSADSAKAKAYCKGEFMVTTFFVTNLNETASRAKAEIESNLILVDFQAIESAKQLDSGLYEFKGYACNSIAARPYLDSLNKYSAGPLKLFLTQELDEKICVDASRTIGKMRGWQRILETFKQDDKNLQTEYENTNAKIEERCKEVYKKQMIFVVAQGTEPKGSDALKNLELYVEEYLVNSALYSQLASGSGAKFKCEVEIVKKNSSYMLSAKIINVSNGETVHNRVVNVESNLKTKDEHKRASMELVNLLLKRCGNMSLGETYEGGCKNGLREGKGKLIYIDGKIYEGEWKANKYQGKGTLTVPNDFVYEGEWKESQKNGKGKQIWSDGEVYNGGFKDGKYYGKGKIIYADSDSSFYEGEFKNGLRDGKGKMTYKKTGKILDGDWKNGSFEGKGKNGKLDFKKVGVFKDIRDEKEYRTIEIGSQTWMAENLNFETNGSKCYGDKPANCDKYGRLYNWEMAMNSCPNGWHLPTKDEFSDLLKNKQPTQLLAKVGWNNTNKNTDDFGFSGLPGGYYSDDFHLLGTGTFWWTSTEKEDKDKARYLWIPASFSGVDGTKSDFFSVRCLKNSEDYIPPTHLLPPPIQSIPPPLPPLLPTHVINDTPYSEHNAQEWETQDCNGDNCTKITSSNDNFEQTVPPPLQTAPQPAPTYTYTPDNSYTYTYTPDNSPKPASIEKSTVLKYVLSSLMLVGGGVLLYNAYAQHAKANDYVEEYDNLKSGKPLEYDRLRKKAKDANDKVSPFLISGVALGVSAVGVYIWF